MSEVQRALERMGYADHEEYVAELHRLERRQRRSMRRLGWLSVRDFDRADPGHPLGKGYPPGRSLREDGESHREAWMRVVRLDPCAYCGRAAGTLDHIEPRSLPTTSLGGVHSWLNYTAACEACNSRKGHKPLLRWMLSRRGVPLFAKHDKPLPRPQKTIKPHVPDVPSSDRGWIREQFRRGAAA